MSGRSPPSATGSAGGSDGPQHNAIRARRRVQPLLGALESGQRLGAVAGACRRRQGDFGEISRPRQLRAGAGRFSRLAGEPRAALRISARGHAWPRLCARRQAGNSGALGRNRMQRADGRRRPLFRPDVEMRARQHRRQLCDRRQSDRGAQRREAKSLLSQRRRDRRAQKRDAGRRADRKNRSRSRICRKRTSRRCSTAAAWRCGTPCPINSR